MEEDKGITPEQPADYAGASSRGRSAPTGLRALLLTMLVVLALLVVAVIWVLPDYVEPVQELDDADAAVVQPDTIHPSEAQTRIARQKREAERALQEVLQSQAALEAQDASAWGGAEYENALQALAAADAAFATGHFESATSGYESAGRLLQGLERSRPQRLEQALAQGAVALGRYDAPAARRQFEIALALDPGSGEAQAGAARAENIGQLVELLRRARESENNGDWTAARQLYAEAVALDARAAEAQKGLQTATAELEAMRFRKLMSTALTAIDSGRFEAAGESLTAAGTLAPESPDVADARHRLDLAVQRHRIMGHRSRAEKFAQTENWHEAVREFDAVLGIDPQAQFAVQGLAKGRRLARLHDQLDSYLHQPERLQSEQPRNNARTLLGTLAETRNQGPRLQQKYRQLAALVELAETPVLIELASDGMTDVTINRVGRFGKFREKAVTLLPGRYIVRGERVGYRDVRLDLEVKVESATPPLMVRCEEKI